jgi:hypothetical protein
MTSAGLLELAPLAALGVLDGTDRTAFEAQSARSDLLMAELQSFERLVGQIGVATAWVEPAPALRPRVLGAASEGGAARIAAVPEAPKATSPGAAAGSGAASRSLGWSTWLPLAAAIVMAVAGLTWRFERDAARREAERARAEAASVVAQNKDLRAQLDTAERRLEASEAFRSLVARPTTHVVSLAGLPAAPAARGRVVWNSERREAVLLVVGLPPVPEGKAYEAWVIASGPPVPAGVFRVNEAGEAVHPLPRLEDTARAKTFAVTLEPEGGTPAPTGPMVLAGSAL